MQSRGRAQYICDLVQGISLIGDTLATFFALVITALITASEPHRAWETAAEHFAESSAHLAFKTSALMAILLARHVYDRHLHVAHRESVLEAITKSLLIWGVAWFSLAAVFHSLNSPSTRYVLRAVPGVALFLITWRAILHRVVSRPGIAQFLKRRVLILGWNSEAASVIECLGDDPTHPYEVAGCLQVSDKALAVPFPKNIHTFGLLSTDPSDPALARLIRNEHIDHVLLADAEIAGPRIAALSRLCENELAELTIIPSYFTLFRSGLRINTVNGVPMVSVSKLPLDSVSNRSIKRLIDILGALVGLTLAAPIIAIFGLLVYRESPGPIFYKQRRLGLKGRHFDMFKIRSMRVDAEVGGKIGWTTKDDPRCLKIGALMRRLNIDEVPQFWNVLIGDMSLVGPRPERPELTVKFNESIDDYNVRHGVKPGMTGLAQVKGLRGDTEIADRIRQDLNYIEHWSVWNDFKIMLFTLISYKNAA